MNLLNPAGANRRKTLWPLRVTLLLLASAGLIALMSTLATRSVTLVSERADWVAHTERVRFEVSRVLRLLTDVETAGRGYVLTANAEFLEPYRKAAPALDHELSTLGQLTIDNAHQIPLAARLRNLSDEVLTSTDQIIEKTRLGQWQEARARISAGEGKRTMDAARETAAEMLAEEDRLLQLQRTEGIEARRNALLAMWSTGILTVFLLCFVVWMTLRDRARVERAEEELATTLRSIGDGVISTDAAGRIRFMNAIAEQLTGWPESEARGRSLDDVFRIVNEQTRATVESPVTQVLREGVIVGLANHTVLLARSGTESAIEDSGAPIRDHAGHLSGVVLVFRDATIQRVAAFKLLESEERFRAAVEAIQGTLWTNSPEGEMRGEQPGWAKLTGQSLEEYHGIGWSKAVHPEDAQPTVDAWLEAVRKRQPFVFEHRVRRFDGQWRTFAVRAIPLFDASGAIREWVGVHTDVTVQRQAELALRETSIRKDIFLATLSHELRNPLAPIRTSTRLLESGRLGAEETARSHAIISRQVRHMASLLDDLLDVSRITRDVLALKKAPVFLRTVLEGALEAARPSIDAKQHTLHLEWPAESIELEADPVRLTQVATNLLTNAAKYTDPRGQIHFGASLEADHLLVYVRDNGIGIAPEMLSQVFEMFTQINADSERSEGGLGIGLALVKGLVELHGGRAEARSDGLLRGSEFRILLPRPIVKVVPAQRETPGAVALPLGQSRRLLIADDNRDGAESLAMLLKASGHTVFLAHTGTDALQLHAEHRPEIAILDIGMPGMTGYEVARHIRQDAANAPVILIAVTGYGQEDDKAKARAAGFDHHLTKPIDTEVLERLIYQTRC